MNSNYATPVKKNNNKTESFNGFLKDKSLKFMAIDSFDCLTQNCKVFLLSHHHTDHMSGLKDFAKVLNQSSDKYIFTSPLTAEYIKNSYGIDPSKTQILPFNKSFVVYTLDDGSDVTVTSVPSGHCPGAVMFVIEYNDKRILYTGDMRMNLAEFKKSQKYLMISENHCRKIDDLYLDSTFALPESYAMPHRDQSVEVILNLVEEWLLDADSKKRIILDIHTCIGSEYLYLSLAKKFKTKIVVHREEFDKFYAGIEELFRYFEVVNDIAKDENWLIHACHRKAAGCNEEACKNSFKTRVIRPSALGYVNKYYYSQPYEIDSNGVAYNKKDDCWVGIYKYSRVVVYYSHHSSLKELRSIVKFIKPTNLYLNTVYKDREEEMYQLLLGIESKSTEENTPAGEGTREKILNEGRKEETYQALLDTERKIISTDFAGDRKQNVSCIGKYVKKKQLGKDIENKLNLW